MRSYYAHLNTISDAAKKTDPKLVFRSSAIFPMIHRDGISARIIFMGYWILKRHIKQVTAVVTLRSETGDVMNRSTFMIEQPKAYRIELSDELQKAGISPSSPFVGSLEVEFFSTVNLVFPFPAVAINYYGPHFSSVVHTAQRVYNNFEDMHENSQTKVPESGFNIYVTDQQEPVFGLVNGPEVAPDAKIEMQFINSNNEKLFYSLDLKKIHPYQTCIIYPAQLMDLKSFLKGRAGTAKIRFNINWIFPRLLVGNIQHSLPAMSITHTYYDCSSAKSDSDFWLPTQPEWYPAALMVPLCIHEDHFTNISFYPIYSPSAFTIDIEIYDSKGRLLGMKQNILLIESPHCEFKQINMNLLCSKLNIQTKAGLAARIIAKTETGQRLPARVKVALDIGQNRLPLMPCNICTNLQPFNPALEKKESTFRWSPILADQPQSSLWIMNSSPAIAYSKQADIQLDFYREMDDATISRHLTLPPQGFVVISPEHDTELATFFGGKIGWCTVRASNPYTTNYYLAENPSGVVGGDHGF